MKHLVNPVENNPDVYGTVMARLEEAIVVEKGNDIQWYDNQGANGKSSGSNFNWFPQLQKRNLRIAMDTHSSTTGPGLNTSSSSSFQHEGVHGSSGLQRRSKPTSYFAHQYNQHTLSYVQNPSLNLVSNRSTAFVQWDDSEFPNSMEAASMKRTASYSSFLSKKPGPMFKSTFQHTRALSGQIQPPDVYSAPPDDSLPTTLTKTPTYEYYGFVLYLVSAITYAFFAINLYNTAPFDSFNTITDEHANQFQTMNAASSLTDDFVPDLMDIPIGMVNACLYQHIEGISDEEEDGEADDVDECEYEESYFDDTNLSDWDDPSEM
ncbi:hypothetical protein BX616_005032 [Lobosporangium transversale]|nr:hypothetical protein BX616_005032 [Lobosporangium transversale]